MNDRIRMAFVASLILGFWLVASVAMAAPPGPSMLEAKKEAESNGFIFEVSHDEIVAEAKKEGSLQVLSGLDSMNEMRDAFMKKYPFINTTVAEITGLAAGQRFLMEIKAGTVEEWDAVHITSEFFNDYVPHMKKFDLLGMASAGVLDVPIKMIDANSRNTTANSSSVSVVAYNKSLISEEKVPDAWEGFLKPELKGKKFIVDIRPAMYAAMVPLMGLEWVLDYGKKLASQNPMWMRGYTRSLTAMAAGEYALHAGVNYHSTVRAMGKDPTGNLQYKVVEPVPVRNGGVQGILKTAPHPYAALLWLEFVASAEGQSIIDKYEPLKSSLYAPGSHVEKLLRGKKVSVLDWDSFPMRGKWTQMVFESFGFPKAEKRRRR